MNEQEQQEFADLRQSLHIHLNELHKDAQKQPDLVYRAGDLSAEAKARAKRAKLEVEEVKAQTDADIRNGPEEFGLAKVTEASIPPAITRTSEVKKVQRERIDCELESDKLEALAESYRHRKAMITDEVELYKANYWGDVAEGQMSEKASDARGQQEHRVEKKRRQRRKTGE